MSLSSRNSNQQRSKMTLTPVASVMLENLLSEEARLGGYRGYLARIQTLTHERQQLYRKCGAHPLLACENREQIQRLTQEIDTLWELLRCERAARRAQIERSLDIIDDDEDENEECNSQTWGGVGGVGSHLQRGTQAA